jgi:hypothetical protein
MAKILQFPTREQLSKEEEKILLNEHLDLCEADLQDAMRMLDELNQEIVVLTHEYTSILMRLKELVLEE